MNVRWRKSRYSSGVNDQHCVELGRLEEGIGVRDSKDPDADHLTLTPAEFATLVRSIKRHGER
ncbi:hypothetical protein Acsp03_32010 [Actinomadura sp. NBRC 104412]|uniref:DUF397 domain-containing protein n=1 Tax=Actinomadura sp. NBRC 104412 TaxID=3032203 RepID=UPI0024A42F78|nr:DUF397 domain-containing protein [Actinomadura sp. NBRC 104412]GLZ05735.1 hypothetical protein Acsp03_32010 [Actinomadura sp. NBRC 104412]